MKIIENSNIVNWDEYPDYICALVMYTTEDIKTKLGLTLPKGKKIIWLLDKAPKIVGEKVVVEHTNICCLGIGPPDGKFSGDFPVDIKEIHFKPKPTTKYISHTECGEPSQA